ncbi:hypothetical protein C8Q76DRAFT_731668 [Earliella scabrosa]|nr:hypothetical protein C8Q76DRAFT_731668 [Earliella scabrosa]
MPQSLDDDAYFGRCSACRISRAELKAPLKRCARCSTVVYCSKECQKSAWPAHRSVSSPAPRPSPRSNHSVPSGSRV